MSTSPRAARRKHKISDGATPPSPSPAAGVGGEDDGEDVGYAPDDEGADLPPGRMHVVNREQLLRLQGKGGGGGHHHTTLSSGSLSSLESGGRNIIMNSAIGPASGSTGAICPPSPRSTRSRSPQTQQGRGTGPEQRNYRQETSEKNTNTNSTFDGNSSISSLDDIVDQDILYDRAGLIDDLSQSSSTKLKMQLHNSREGFTNLTPVTERLSEETLEDVHAFSDLTPPNYVGGSGASSTRSQTSRANSQATSDREGVLAALDECAEEDEESLEDPSESELGAQHEVILLTNMEKVDLNAGNSRSEDDGDGAGGGLTASLAGTDVGVGGGSAMGTASNDPPPPPAAASS